MYNGKITNFHPKSGAGYIKSKDFADSVYCHKTFVDREHLKVNDFVDFDAEKGPQGFRVTNILKLEQKHTLFEFALKIDKLSAEDYDKFCEEARDYVRQKDFNQNVTTSKIRNIFAAVQNAQTIKDIKMLRPKLAYQSGRDNKTRLFMTDLDKLIKQISNEEELKNFKQFFEAIVCYKREIEK